mgnify:CR=1 FL=1
MAKYRKSSSDNSGCALVVIVFGFFWLCSAIIDLIVSFYTNHKTIAIIIISLVIVSAVSVLVTIIIRRISRNKTMKAQKTDIQTSCVDSDSKTRSIFGRILILC